MAKRKSKSTTRSRRTFTKEFKREAVQMMLDDHANKEKVSGTNGTAVWPAGIYVTLL